MNKTTFFAYARRAPLGGRLSQAQVDGTSAMHSQRTAKMKMDAGNPDGWLPGFRQ
jgi:putative chitinase